MDLKINLKLFWSALFLIVLSFSLSFLVYFDTVFHENILLNNFFFLLFLVAIAFLSFKNIKAGLYIVLLELLLGSQGYLFDWKFSPDPDAFRISLRLAIFAILSFSFLWQIIKQRQIKFFQKSNKALWQLALLFLCALLFSALRAYFWDYPLGMIFSDINNYFFFFYLLIAWQQKWEKADAEILLSVGAAGILFLNILTFFAFYVFSHLIVVWMLPLYKWIRDARLGEIARMSMDHSIHRVFMQNHIYLVLVFLAGFLLIYFWPEKYKISWKKGHRLFTSLMFTTVMAILLSQSRSFWLGGAVAFCALFFFLLKKFNWRHYLKALGASALTLILALAGITALIFIDLSFGLGSFGNLSFLADRVNISDAAVSSRWNQLPVLWEAIKSEAILGYGFGKTLTYQSDDPRIISDFAVNGLYTTSAFEWGYLEMWLKFGLLGLLFYAALIFYIFRRLILLYRKNSYCSLLGILTLIFLLTTHIFTPYLNHPLGIALLIVLAVAEKEITGISLNSKNAL